LIGRNYGLEKKQLWDMRDLIGEVRRSLELMGVAPLPHQARPAHLHLLLRLAIFAAFYPNYYVQVTSIPRVPGLRTRFFGFLIQNIGIGVPPLPSVGFHIKTISATKLWM
jgi:hypothetical protein